MVWALVPETWCEKKRSGLFLQREQTQQLNAAVRGAFRHVRLHEQNGAGVKIKLPILLDASRRRRAPAASAAAWAKSCGRGQTSR